MIELTQVDRNILENWMEHYSILDDPFILNDRPRFK